MSGPDEAALAELRERLGALRAEIERLQAWGRAHAFPAVTYNAERLEATLAALELQVHDLAELTRQRSA